MTAVCFAAILALAACNKEDTPAGSENFMREVKIVATINGHTPTRITLDADGAGTFQTGDKFRMACYYRGSADAHATRTYEVGESKFFWHEISEGGKSVDFVAWHPDVTTRVPVPNSSTLFYVPVKEDFLLAQRVTVDPGETVTLQFRHAMHKLKVNLASNFYNAESLAAATVTLGDVFETYACIDFREGLVDEANAMSGGGGAPEISYPVGTGANIAFIVAPQVLAADAPMLYIQVDGDAFVYRVPATIPGAPASFPTALRSGKVLTLNLTVNRDAVVLESGNISGWGNQGTIEGIPQEQPPV